MVDATRAKRRRIVAVVVVAVCLFWLFNAVIMLFPLRYPILAWFHQTFPPAATCEELTLAEKQADFRYCYDCMVYGNPSMPLYEDSFGVDIEEKRQLYEGMIAETKSNYEYLCVLDAFIQEIPSYHTDLMIPGVGDYNLGCFGVERIRANRDTVAAEAGWSELLDAGIEAYRDTTFFIYDYSDGAYVLRDDDGGEGRRLTEVDGVPVDTYVEEACSVFDRYYDGKNEKVYRTRIVFNDSHGEKVRLKTVSSTGDESEEEVYADLFAAEASWLLDYDDDDEEPGYLLRGISGICYIRLDEMEWDTCEELAARLEALEDNQREKIILDLRDNQGGLENIFEGFVYPYLGVEDVEETKEWYMPYYGENIRAYRELSNKLHYRLLRKSDDTGEKIISAKTHNTFYGDAANADSQIVVLTSNDTGSAADETTSVLKGQENVTVIGNNTGGEGQTSTFAAATCPNSRLVFCYMPSRLKDPQAAAEAVTGTKPDIYVAATLPATDVIIDVQNDAALAYAIDYLKKTP